MNETLPIEASSGNVFADLGLPAAGSLLAKAQLAARIQAFLEQQNISDDQAATQLSLTAAQVTNLLDGGFDTFTFDQLFHILNRLGLAIEVRVSPPAAANAPITVIAA